MQIGTDEVIDLLEGWGPESPRPLRLNKLSADRLPEVALLFGGVGDGKPLVQASFPQIRRPIGVI